MCDVILYLACCGAGAGSSTLAAILKNNKYINIYMIMNQNKSAAKIQHTNKEHNYTCYNGN